MTITKELEKQTIVDPDHELVQALKAGDRGAWRELVERHYRRTFGLVMKILGDRHIAEDVTQEVFTQVYRKIDGFRGNSRLSTWLFRVTVNACRSRRRRIERLRRLDLRRLADERGDRGLMDPQRELERNQLRDDIAQALGTLTKEHRQILLLKTVDELSYDAIAEATNLTRPRVRGKLYRARKAFRRAYDNTSRAIKNDARPAESTAPILATMAAAG